MYTYYKTLGGARGRSGRGWEVSTSSGLDPRTVYPVANSYIEYAILATIGHFTF